MTGSYTSAPSLEEIEAIAVEAFAAIPERFRALVGDVVFHVTDFPDEKTEREMGLESPFDLLGLYHGTPIPDQGAGHSAQDVDHVFLYRRPILEEWCATGEDLKRLVRNVLIHEIGHHFGLSDEDMDRIENAD